MNDARDDERDLRERFRSLREEERMDAARFTQLPAAAARRTPSRRPRLFLPFPLAAAAMLVASAGTIVVLSRGEAGGSRTARESAIPAVTVSLPDVMSGAWESPTDFLLVTTGAELLHAVPTFEGLDRAPDRRPSASPSPSSSATPVPGRSLST